MRSTTFLVPTLLIFTVSYASSSGRDSVPRLPNPDPERFHLVDGQIREYGHPNARPCIVGPYFLGMVEKEFFYPVVANKPNMLYDYITRKVVTVTLAERNALLEQFAEENKPPRPPRRQYISRHPTNPSSDPSSSNNQPPSH